MGFGAWVPWRARAVHRAGAFSAGARRRSRRPFARVFRGIELASRVAAADICQRKAEALDTDFRTSAPIPIAGAEHLLEVAPPDARVQARASGVTGKCPEAS